MTDKFTVDPWWLETERQWEVLRVILLHEQWANTFLGSWGDVPVPTAPWERVDPNPFPRFKLWSRPARLGLWPDHHCPMCNPEDDR